MSGCPAVRTGSRSPGHGVVLSTGSHEHAAALEESGHRYILKPYRIAALLALVDDVLQQTRRRCGRAEREERVA
jgi:DNA-binding response OmpR family regulator